MSANVLVPMLQYKRWAGRGLYEVISQHLEQIETGDRAILMRILDHILAVDLIFQANLQHLPQQLKAPRSTDIPSCAALAEGSRQADNWYVAYVRSLAADEFDQVLDFRYTNGSPASMSRRDMLLHVCLHGTYHRGNAGILLQKNGIPHNNDRFNDFLEQAA